MRLENCRLICPGKVRNTNIRKRLVAEVLIGSIGELCTMYGNFPILARRVM